MSQPDTADYDRSLPPSKGDRYSLSALDLAALRESMHRSSASEASATVRRESTGDVESLALMERPVPLFSSEQSNRKKRAARQRALPNNSVLKRFNLLYWRRLFRYFYIRFLRMQGSPHAIARGIAAGVFAGAFPLLGFQTIIGVAIAATIRGNKIMAAVGTWISNPLTYVPIFALNFHVGRWLLRLPNDIMMPSASAGTEEWMSLGVSASASLLLGSFVVGIAASSIAYYFGLRIALFREKKQSDRR
ncbi:hypothetical protein S7335_3740 [Synechococcus sp. PCC 7335]|nr:hypothetical protein S7335_3740 [Synechococcus sp. PCC 7335]